MNKVKWRFQHPVCKSPVLYNSDAVLYQLVERPWLLACHKATPYQGKNLKGHEGDPFKWNWMLRFACFL